MLRIRGVMAMADPTWTLDGLSTAPRLHCASTEPQPTAVTVCTAAIPRVANPRERQ